MTVFDPKRKHNVRGEERLQALMQAAAVVFARSGYHETTTNAIASQAGVSPATLYHFFPNKEAIASALTSAYAREMAASEHSLDPCGELSFAEAVSALIDLCIAFNRERPEFHTLVMNAPLSQTARKDKEQLGQVFVDFIADRIRRERPNLSRAKAQHHGRVALLIFRGILDELSVASPRARPPLQQAMREAIIRYLTPVLTE